jgi:predicted RNase H-like nuclease
MIGSADGCKAGWLLAIAEAWPSAKPPLVYVCGSFEGLVATTRDCEAVMVDIPIGLPSGSAKRSCDVEARRILGNGGASRVFFAPPREILFAATPMEFQAAHRNACGIGAGLPVWGIIPKLREVDCAMTPAVQARIKEFHPELAWARLAGHVMDSKHTQAGVSTRLALLSEYVAGLDALAEWTRKLGRSAGIDDLLDALVGLSVAESVCANSSVDHRIPTAQPQIDARGLRMEIWF